MKKDFWISVLAFLFVILLDLSSKFYVASHSDVYLNTGIMLGFLQHLPKSLTLVTLCSFGGVLFFFYLMAIYILSSELKVFKIGLSFFISGILSNVIDRAIHGGTIDFIPLLNFSVFNIADAFQWLGVVFISYMIIFKDHIIWFPENQRSFKLINPKEQLKFAFKLTMISFATLVALGIFTISYLTLIFQDSMPNHRSFILGYALSFSSLAFFFCLLVFVAGVILSQRIVGPLYAFELYVEDLLKGDKRKLKLREGDNFKHLEDVADKLSNHFK